jgi:tetratricopeptide (TPR) repeat protein
VCVLILLGLLGLAGYVGVRELWAWRHFRAAEEDLQRYHTEGARAHLQNCLEVWPRDARTLLLAARVARQAGELEQALDYLREYDALPGRDAEARDLELRLVHAAAGDVDPVEEYLQTLVEKGDPQAASILEALTTGYLRTYRQREAMLCLDLWLALQPDSPQALFLRGRAAQRQHEHRLAADDFRRVLDLDLERDDARLRLAQSLLETGAHAAALEHLEVLRGRRPEDPEVLTRIAFAHCALGRPEEAVPLLDAVLAGHPGYLSALRGRGEVALQTGHADQAEDWLRQALAAGPHDRQATFALQQCLERQGKRDEARAVEVRRKRLEADLLRVNEIATRLLPARPRDPNLQCELGMLLLQTGHEEVGERWLRSALTLDPNCTAAHQALVAYYASGRQPPQ